MAGPIRIAILANGRQARREINTTSSSLSRLGRLAKSGLGVAGVGTLTYGLLSLGKAAIGAEAEFSTSMRLIQAATKAPESAMGRLNDLAIKLGNDTAFSAGEAADAMLELAKAGLDTNTILRGGLAGTLQLAAAGGTDLATASTIASNALNTFSLRGKDMASVAAALAGGANASTASVQSLGQALSQVGPGAVNAGLSLQETVGALAAFDSAGIKGSDAGTSLKTMLARLVPQTAKASEAMKKLRLDFTDADGEFLSLADIAQQLQDRLGKLTPELRQTALNTVFGSDATRAATVLMKEGAEGVREYTKAAQDQSAAQKMANARMGGTAGALERLSGAAETAALRIGQELAPVVVDAADGLADNMGPALEDAIDGTKDLIDTVTPAVLALKDLAGVGIDVGRDLGGPAVDALKELAQVGLDAIELVGKLPDPIKEIGIQAGIAALVLPRLSAGVTSVTTSVGFNIARLQQWRAEMTYTATRAQNLAAMTTRLGAAARTAAGVGGMVALAQGAEQTNTALRSLTTVAGGALLGFSVGGPWGAAIGAGAAGLWELYRAVKGTSTATQEARTSTVNFTDALEASNGAITEQIRQMIALAAQQNGVAGLATRLGINQRDLVGAVQGNAAATKRLSAAYRENFDLLDGSEQADFNSWLRDNTNALARQRAEVKATDEAAQKWGAALKGLPEEAATEVKAIGLNITRQQLDGLRREYDLTPKQVRTVIEAVGSETTVRKIKGVYQVLDASGRIKADLTPFQRSFLSQLGETKQDATLGGLAIGRSLKETTGRARADLNPFQRFFTSDLSQLEGQARTGGQGVGSALGSGIQGGIAGALGAVAAAARSVVAQAMSAARDEAKVNSPSKRMIELGQHMGDGLVIGLTARRARAQEAARRLTRDALVAAEREASRPRAGDVYTRTGAGQRRELPRTPRQLTLIVEGKPFTAIVRDELAAYDSWGEGLGGAG